MSLDWNSRACPGNKVTAGWIPDDPDNPDTKYHIHPDTNSLVWGAFCGYHIAVITPKNIDEVIWRIEFLKRVNLPWMSDKSFPTPEAVDAHIGLRTNCVAKTRKAWLKFVTELLSKETDRAVTQLHEEAA